MVRKIPVRKHRGVKDPLAQIARRNADSSINAAPSNPKEQELPKSILEIQRLCQLAERSQQTKKKKKNSNNSHLIDSSRLYDKDPVLRGMRRRDKGMPRIVQREGESDETFVNRFSHAAQEFIKEVELENKHNVHFDDDSKEENKVSNGKTKKRKAEFDPFSLDNDKFNRRKRRRGVPEKKGAKPNKAQRRKQRRQLINKEDHYENELYDSEEEKDFNLLKDEVAFGEVVHRPPQFTAKPRGSELSSKPGTKDLLLKQMMSGSASKEATKSSNFSKYSNSQKHKLEKERLRVIQAYRDMKASKAKNKT